MEVCERGEYLVTQRTLFCGGWVGGCVAFLMSLALRILCAVEPIVVLNDSMTIEEIDQLIKKERIDAIVISPGPGTPCSPKDAGINLKIFQTYKHIPILGVCFGFQTLCLVHGNGSIVKAPEPVHGRISIVDHCGDAMFEGIPSGEDFEVVRYHSLCVDEATLGDSVISLAWCTSIGHHAVGNNTKGLNLDDGSIHDSERISRVLMAARHREYPHYGVQFHPESIATQYGYQLLDNFRKISLEYISHRMPDVENGFPKTQTETSETARMETLHVNFQRLENMSVDISQLINTLYSTTENLFWLDSASKERTRFSFVGSTGGTLWRRVSYHLNEDSEGGILKTVYPDGSSRDTDCRSIFDWINKEMSVFSDFDEAFQSLPFEFWGGLVGYLGYELKSQTGGSKSYCSPYADACFFVVDRYLAFDHHTNDIYVIAVYTSDEHESTMWVNEMSTMIQMIYNKERDVYPSSSVETAAPQACFEERHTKPQYVAKVKQCLAALQAGDSYELCLTNMLTARKFTDAWLFYRMLRLNNPAPYSAFMNFSSCLSGPTICCSSPERFLRGTMQGHLEAKPIKGTAKRNLDDLDDDAKIAESLYHSEKDRAENLMIVDLLRNDLGRVSETGTVSVPGLMQIESFATVHQMVSTIVSKKKASIGVGDIVKACFPGGSMTGAPKIRSMEILDTLEEGPRGIYSGSLGFISWNQAFDLNIIIRTAIFHDEEILIGAGGAIVVQSDPVDEYEEMKLKFQTLSTGGIKST